MNKLKVLELFSGIGACSKALKNLGVDYEIVDSVEIDKHAVKSFNVVHGTNFKPQDITQWDKDIKVDLIMHGSPCQSYSIAGKQDGGDEGSGTRSSLMYETVRIVTKLKPKYVIWENVKNVLSTRHVHNFNKYIDKLNDLGYTSFYSVLNAKDYGVPQSRERVFVISILDCKESYSIPQPINYHRTLAHVLEEDVDEKFFLSGKTLNACTIKGTDAVGVVACAMRGRYNDTENNNGIKQQIEMRKDGLSNCITTVQKDSLIVVEHGAPLKSRVCDTAIEMNVLKPFDIIDYTYSRSRLDELKEGCISKKNTTNNQIANTLTTSPSNFGVCVNNHGNLRVRKLTPKECWLLMGFSADDFYKAEKVNSDAQLYKQAGNSIVVNVLEAILKNLLER